MADEYETVSNLAIAPKQKVIVIEAATKPENLQLRVAAYMGGVCYFLWDRNSPGQCKVLGMSTFIRNNEMISILHKVQAGGERSFSEVVSANDPFGFDIRENNGYRRIKPKYSLQGGPDSIFFYYNGWRKDGIGYVEWNSVRKGHEWIDKCKILVHKAWGVGNPAYDWLNPFIAKEHLVCTETYLVVGPFESQAIAQNVISYINTRFFHLKVAFLKITQNTMQKAYSLVPMQDFSKPWTDDELFEKYDLTDGEISFILSTIKPLQPD